MNRVRASRLFALGLGAALLVAGPGALADTPSSDAQAEAIRLYNAGAEAAHAGHTKEAYDLYVRAWQRARLWRIAASMGQLEHGQKKYRDAAEHLEFAVREAPPDMREAVRKATSAMLAEARSKVGALSITVDPPGAEVLVDGKVVGKAPLPGVVFVESGPVFVEARLEGYEGVRASRSTKMGAVETIQIVLRPTAAVRPTRVSPTPARSTWPSKALMIAFGTASGALVAVGAGLAVASNGKASESDKYTEGGGGCLQATPECLQAHRALRESSTSLKNLSLQAFLGAGLAGACTGAIGIASILTTTKKNVGTSLVLGPDRAVGTITLTW